MGADANGAGPRPDHDGGDAELGVQALAAAATSNRSGRRMRRWTAATTGSSRR